jgi:hypothetical protein
MTANATPIPPTDPERKRMVDTLLRGESGVLAFTQSLTMGVGAFLGVPPDAKNPVMEEQLARLEKRRQALLALPIEQLRSMYSKQLASDEAAQQRTQANKAAKLKAEAARKEAAKFYNLPSAVPDFDHWAKAAYWTLDESVALLLGREPTVLTPRAVQQELAGKPGLPLSKSEPPSPLITQYLRLRDLARRALEGERLIPARVVEWAIRSGAVAPPAPLVQRLAPPVEGGLALQGEQLTEPKTTEQPTPPQASVGTGKRWTDEKLSELAAYRDRHGAKAAAAHFGISTGRIRQLLPGKPAGHSAFTYRPK